MAETKLASGRLRVFLTTCRETMRRAGRTGSGTKRFQRVPGPRPWPIGAVLVDMEEDLAGFRVSRMVIGYAPDGDCLTVFVDPPPWFTEAQARQVYRGLSGLAPAA